MVGSIKNPPYLFTTKTIFHAGRYENRLIQIAGRAGEVGRVFTSRTSTDFQKSVPVPSRTTQFI